MIAFLLLRPLFSSLIFLVAIVVVNGQEATVVVCDDENIHKCANGGMCEKSTNRLSREIVQICNCDNATDTNGNEYNGIYCQNLIPRPDESPVNYYSNNNNTKQTCDNDSSCYNNGVCINNKCVCFHGFKGQFCEQAAAGNKNNNNNNKNDNDNDSVVTTSRCNDGSYCLNNGICSDDDGKCICHDGFEGRFCQNLAAGNNSNKEISYNNNGNNNFDKSNNNVDKIENSNNNYLLNSEEQQEQQLCGDQPCQHGSICIDLSTLGGSFIMGDSKNNNKRYMCDCSSMNKVSTDVAFAGKYCEVPSTSICSKKDDFNGKQFCTNYGTCINLRNGLFPCSCPNGYTGKHCEFSPQEPSIVHQQCTQTICQNGGLCQFGTTKDHGIFSDMMMKSKLNGMKESLSHLFPATNEYNDNFEHCICPNGYAGTLCEHQAEVCPDKKYVCFHGSKCIENNVNNNDNNDSYGCSCNNDQGKKTFSDDNTNLRNSGSSSSTILDNNNDGDDEVNEKLLNNSSYQGSSDDVGNNNNNAIIAAADDENRRQQRSLLNFQVNYLLGGTHCQYKATSNCGNRFLCFNDGVCQQNNKKCICRDGFEGQFCEYTRNTTVLSRRENNDNGNSKNIQQQQQEEDKIPRDDAGRYGSTIIVYTFSSAFIGIAIIFLGIAYIKLHHIDNKASQFNNNNNNNDICKEALTGEIRPSPTTIIIDNNKQDDDVNAKYLETVHVINAYRKILEEEAIVAELI